MDLDDFELMRRFQQGDEAAYEILVRRHLNFVVRHAQRFVGDVSSAEDVAQDVFLRVFKSKDRFKKQINFTGWLATITGRIALNEIRTRQRKRWLPRSALDNENAGTEWRGRSGDPDDPSEETLRNERIEKVRAAILELPDNQQQAILLQVFEGWDLVRIGRALSLGVPAVKSLLHRARKNLAKQLESFIVDSKGNPELGASETEASG